MKWEWLKETRRILIFLVVSGISKGKYSPINIQYKEAMMRRKELRRRGHIHPHSSPGGEVSEIYGQGSKLCSWRWIPIFWIEESFPKLEIPTQETTSWVFFCLSIQTWTISPKRVPVSHAGRTWTWFQGNIRDQSKWIQSPNKSLSFSHSQKYLNILDYAKALPTGHYPEK